MKDTAFIICEYNPFHNGHALHIQKTRDAGAKYIICLMSGNFMQRGEIAFCDKGLRAKWAIDHGADLVMELPVKNVLSGASYFAGGAAQIIRTTGIDGTLSFGSSGCLKDLMFLSDSCSDPEVHEKVNAYSLHNGTTYALALHRVLDNVAPEKSDLLKDPNNILAIEYINAIRNMDLNTDFFAVDRGLLHDAETPLGEYASAKYLRDIIRKTKSISSCAQYLPSDVASSIIDGVSSGTAPSDLSRFSVAAMSRLYTVTKDDLLQINGVNQGLENRIIDCIKNNNDLFELFDAVKTKRFTHARIRQILLSAVLGIKKEALERENPYIRVLGISQNGRGLLKNIRNSSLTPVVMNLSEAPDCEEKEIDFFAGKLFELCRPVSGTRNPEFELKPYVSG